MLKKAKENFAKAGGDPDRIIWGDIQDPVSYPYLLKNGPYDALIAMGVMPHVDNDGMVLDNMATLVRPGGTVFLEFRNKLFSLFTFNRYTMEFIMDDLLCGVSQELKKAVEKELKPRLRMDCPPVRSSVKGEDDAPGYDVILSKFHNPLEMKSLFEAHGFSNIEFLWYHYHPAMPFMENEHFKAFRHEGVRLEHETSGWRGLFLCSAFVVQATRNEE